MPYYISKEQYLKSLRSQIRSYQRKKIEIAVVLDSLNKRLNELTEERGGGS